MAWGEQGLVSSVSIQWGSPCPTPSTQPRSAAGGVRCPQAGSRCPLVATKHHGTAVLSRATGLPRVGPHSGSLSPAAHLQSLLGSQGADEGRHGAQVPRAHAGERPHDILVQGTQQCAQAPRQLQHLLGVRLGEEGRGQRRRGAGGPEGLGRVRTGTHWVPGLGQAAPLLAEGVQGPEGGVQAAAALQLRRAPHWDLGHRQCLAQGLLPAPCRDCGDGSFLGAWNHL